jgi:D-xylulose reductase
MGPNDARIRVHTVGICGSDVHYYTHGRIGPFCGERTDGACHEAAGTVVAIGSAGRNLKPGNRVCMEPGIPDLFSLASKLGMYNVDPAVKF